MALHQVYHFLLFVIYAVFSYHSYICSVCSWHWQHDISTFHDLQFNRRHTLGIIIHAGWIFRRQYPICKTELQLSHCCTCAYSWYSGDNRICSSLCKPFKKVRAFIIRLQGKISFMHYHFAHCKVIFPRYRNLIFTCYCFIFIPDAVILYITID
jgi:hypothetical protein